MKLFEKMVQYHVTRFRIILLFLWTRCKYRLTAIHLSLIFGFFNCLPFRVCLAYSSENFDVLFLVMGFISLVDEIQFILIQSIGLLKTLSYDSPAKELFIAHACFPRIAFVSQNLTHSWPWWTDLSVSPSKPTTYAYCKLWNFKWKRNVELQVEENNWFGRLKLQSQSDTIKWTPTAAQTDNSLRTDFRDVGHLFSLGTTSP